MLKLNVMETDAEKILLATAMQEVKLFLDIFGYGFKAQVLSLSYLSKKKRILIRRMLKERIEVLEPYVGLDSYNSVRPAIRCHKSVIAWLDLFEKNKLKKFECYLVLKYFKYKIMECDVKNLLKKFERFLLFRFLHPTKWFKSSQC